MTGRSVPARGARALRAHRSWKARLSRIGVRLLLFNVLAVVMPVAGILYLDVYEQQLLAGQERAMTDQGRLVVAALSGAADLDTADATRLLTRLTPGDARIRVHDTTGAVVADSARLSPRAEPPAGASYDRAIPTRDEWLYRLGAWLAALRQRAAARLRWGGAPAAPMQGGRPSEPPPEVMAAVAGRFSAATRPTPGQRSLTLTVALPITTGGRTIGAVSVSQSTFRILQALYTVRLRIFRIVVGTLALSVAISAVLTLTIVWPIRRLRRAALSLAHGGRTVPTEFPGTARRDEVGDLARALEELTRRLQAHVALLEAFAADVAHEFRNPLASVRTALDVLDDTPDPAERARFLELIRRDLARLDRLVVGVRDLARIDSAIERDRLEVVDLDALVADVVTHRYTAAGVRCGRAGAPVLVRAHPDRLVQVVENLVDNAVGFSPEAGSVSVATSRDGAEAVVAVADRGPGIPEEHRQRIFERFFSYRPGAASARHEHAGLGLAIAHAIVTAYGGRIEALPHDGGGALIEVRLPLA